MRFQRPNPISYGDMLWRWWRAHVLEMVFSCVVYAWFLRQPAAAVRLAPAGAALRCGDCRFSAARNAVREALEGRSITQASGFNWFLEYAWTTFAFVTVVGVCNARHSRARKAWLRAQTENLGLRLELEQQRILALRGQLNPHFLFNALNAISALVRSSDGKLALA
ncbi:histidine kinase [Massilia sp. H-1]|nr:histidine kinase [Massilia sp. H-1]